MKPLRLAVTALTILLGSATMAMALPQGTITSISPASGPTAGGTTVEISGTYLWGAFGPEVTIGGVMATEVSHSGYAGSPETVTVIAPPHAAGAVDVVVSEYSSETARVDRGFTYIDPTPETPAATGPTVTAISPASGLSTGSESVTITGTRFSGDTAPTVTIGGTAATSVTVVNDTTLTAVTPGHAPGAVDVTVARGTEGGTLAGGYTYAQGYWLTVNSTRPADIGGLASPGAIRTPSFGNWGNTDVTESTSGNYRSVNGRTTIRTRTSNATGSIVCLLLCKKTTITTHTGYAGGINCGARSVTREAIILFPRYTRESWEAGTCRYAFPSGTQVALTALPSASDTSVLGILSVHFQGGFLGAWRNDCARVTTSTCTVQMTADRTAGAAWGYIKLILGGVVGNVVYPTYDAKGELQYYNTSALFLSAPTVVGGNPTYWFGVTMPAKAAGATEHAATRGRGQVVCRTAAHAVGKRLTAQCAVTPPLARALRRGSVRATGTWYVRLPHASALQPIGRSRLMLRGRRVSAITG